MSHRAPASTFDRRRFLERGGQVVGGYALTRLLDARAAFGHPAAPYKIAPVKDPAAVWGRVRYEGKVPAPVFKLVLSDFEVAGRAPRRWEALSLGPENAVQRAVVILHGIAAGKAHTPTRRLAYVKGADIFARTDAYGLDQPEIIMDVENRDPIFHSWVSSLGPRTLVNAAHPAGAPALKVRFKAPGLYEITCAPHPWERAFRFVVPHPYFAVSAADGSFRIDDVPRGKYRATVWAEGLEPTPAVVDATKGTGALNVVVTPRNLSPALRTSV